MDAVLLVCIMAYIIAVAVTSVMLLKPTVYKMKFYTMRQT